MSRFADATATRTVDFGACDCPGTPHESDWAKVRAELSTTEIAALESANAETIADALAPLVVEWNLLGPDGQPWPPTPEALTALKPPTLTPLVGAIGESVTSSSALPNASGAPSASSSRASASPTRATRARR